MIPSADLLDWARQKDEKLSRQHGPGLFSSSSKWAGYVAEPVVADWARRAGLAVEENGGFDIKPDVVIGGIRFGVKGCAVDRAWLPEVKAVIPVEHLEKTWDYWVFVTSVKEPPHETYILGCITPLEFRLASTDGSGWLHPCRYLPGIDLLPLQHLLSYMLP